MSTVTVLVIIGMLCKKLLCEYACTLLTLRYAVDAGQAE